MDSAIGFANSVKNLDLNMMLYIGLGIVGLYVLIMIGAAIKGGIPAIVRVWFWTKKLWWLALVVIGFILILYANSRRGKKKDTIEVDIQELKRIDNKTNEDRRKLETLENKKAEVETQIIETTKKYQEKLEKLKERPDEPKPGDAAASSDSMNDVWK